MFTVGFEKNAVNWAGVAGAARSGAIGGAVLGGVHGALQRDEKGERGGIGGALKGAAGGALIGGAAGAVRGSFSKSPVKPSALVSAPPKPPPPPQASASKALVPSGGATRYWPHTDTGPIINAKYKDLSKG